MKHEKKALLKTAYQRVLDVTLLDVKAPLKWIDGYVAENVTGRGTASDETFYSRADYKKIIVNSRKQSRNIAFHAKLLTRYAPKLTSSDIAVFYDEVLVTIGKGKQQHHLHLSVSTTFAYQNNRWQLINLHASLPDPASNSADTFHLDEANQRLRLLEEKVAEKTAALVAKNRDLAIEAALEKVRARAMSMHKSSELIEVANTMREQLSKLGQHQLEAFVINLYTKGASTHQSWYAFRHSRKNTEQKLVTGIATQVNDSCKLMQEVVQSYFSGKRETLLVVRGRKLSDWYKVLSKAIPTIWNEIKKNPYPVNYWNLTSFSGGAMLMVTAEPPTAEAKRIQKRCTEVFDLAFRRFQDLQKAEAQAREAQIEAALERVRAASLAMQDSSALGEIIYKVYSELTKLDAKLDRCFIMIVHPENKGITWWLAGKEGLLAENGFFIQMNQHPSHLMYLDYWKKRKKKWQYLFEGREKAAWDRFGFTKTALARLPDFIKKDMAAIKKVHLAGSSDQFGSLVTGSIEPLPEAQQEIINRFARAFNQAYVRFLDLQKAEAQAREAKIEASLERVRSHTMGLRKSEELVQVINVIFEELKQLGLDVYETGIYLRKGSSREFSVWAKSITGDEFFTSFDFPFIDHPVLNKVIDNLDKQKVSATFNMGGQDLTTYLDLMFSIEQFKVIQPATKASYYALDTIHVAQAYFQHGFLEIAGVKPIAEDLIEVGRRFTQVIDLAYTRFLDLQKAEAQAREAQIEAALERVRAQSMAMHKSYEIGNVVFAIDREAAALGVSVDNTSIITDFDLRERGLNNWLAASGKQFLEVFHIPYQHTGLQVVENIYKAINDGIDYYSEQYTKADKNKYFKWLFNNSDFKKISEERKAFVFSTPGWTRATVLLKNSILIFQRYSLIGFTEEESAIFKRFGVVFDQAYTRFLDLQKAEAQAREAQVEAALERVRSRTMGMQKSTELNEVAFVLFEQIRLLGGRLWGTGFALCNAKEGEDEFWFANEMGVMPPISIPNTEDEVHVAMLQGWKENRDYLLSQKEGEALAAHYRDLYSLPQVKAFFDPMLSAGFQFPNWQQWHAAYFSKGYLLFITTEPYAESDIFRRFAKVFDQTYTRFLDLQKAEAQTREAQIEASLEKVRSVAMGMRKAADLLDICETSYAELIKLGFTELRNTMINIHDDSEETFLNYDYSVYAGKAVTKYGYHIHPVIRNLVSKSRAAQDAFVDIGLYGTEFEEWKKFRSKSGEQDDDRLNSINHLNYYFYSIGIGSIGISTFESISEQKLNTLKRFRNVFQLAYQRFTDLTLAEAQAREAQIETALERVRARTMAMQKSEELSAVAHVLFEEFKQLNLSLGDKLSRAFVITVDEEKESFQFFITTSEGNYLPVVYPLPFKEKTNGVPLAKCWRLGEAMLINVIEGAAYKQWLKYLDSIQLYISPDIKALKKRVNHYVRFSKGFLGITANEVLEDDAVALLQRFAKVFDQTFTRFVDLQIAEASAKEAIKQAALDRIRANIASMRTVEDLDRITPIIWNELRVLGIPFVRCGIFIMDESLQQIHTFLSSPNGGHIAAYYMRFQETPHVYAMVEHWRKHAKFIERWTLSEFTLLATSLYQQGAIKDKDQYLQSIPADGMWLHFIPFMQGMLYVGNESSLPEDAIDTLAAVADAFSTAYARYEDFNKLEQAKIQVENTLVDLKQAQKQLVQSEKMASLGELTAGIAHEIQNPLNFVNNFSEVTQELLEELRQELKYGNTDGVQDLMDDIIQNLEKINHHGKRADGIVKGMLQHSRTSSGQKELVDINVLCDEYLRLSYHGLRAKDKSFNAKFETSFDDTITKVNVMPQEMGRVILNLINNAFYAVSKKLQDGAADYVPTVRIRTQKDADKILISVEDNGMGIPEQIKDKIFQPFFTTKPTGQGTGLGLSLSYDIVKAHGGELQINSEEGIGTVFQIILPF